MPHINLSDELVDLIRDEVLVPLRALERLCLAPELSDRVDEFDSGVPQQFLKSCF
jgi:hypothetical protein